MALGNVNITVNSNSVMTIRRIAVSIGNGAQQPIALKNLAGDLPTVGQLRNVNVVSANGGEVVVYNANTNNYDVRDLTLTDIDLNNANLDAGSF